MSVSNGVIRIGRKGIKKFAFGEDGAPFEVDVVSTFQRWLIIDESLRQQDGDKTSSILTEDMPGYHIEAVRFVSEVAGLEPTTITVAEALDFLARLREQWDELADFFRPKRREKEDSPDTSAVELRFSEEPAVH